MEHMDSIVDLIRTMAKRCDQLEEYKRQAELYRRWWNEEQAITKRLKDKYEGEGEGEE